EPSLAQQPLVKQQEKPQDKEPAEKQDAVKVVKPGKYVQSLAYCIGGKTVAVAPWDGTPRTDSANGSVGLWDLQKAKGQTLELSSKDSTQVWHVTSSKDGGLVAAAGYAVDKDVGAIRVWEAKTGMAVQNFEPDGHPNSVVLSPDGKKLATGIG